MKTKPFVPKLLRWTSLVLLVAALATWALTGANGGWTRTEVTTIAVDEVTGLEYPQTSKAFQPGVDFLAVVLAGAAVLNGAAWLLTSRRQNHV